MYCPRCGQARTMEETRYCSRCGFLMTGLKEFVRFGGQMPRTRQPSDPDSTSPRIRGLKQGGTMFLSGFIIVPLLIFLLAGILDVEPILAGVAAVVLFWGGILRMVYALVFQPNVPTSTENAGFFSSLKQTFISRGTVPQRPLKSLDEPNMADFPNASMNWRESDDLEYSRQSDNVTSTLDRS